MSALSQPNETPKSKPHTVARPPKHLDGRLKSTASRSADPEAVAIRLELLVSELKPMVAQVLWLSKEYQKRHNTSIYLKRANAKIEEQRRYIKELERTLKI